jgi:hypothetical protein
LEAFRLRADALIASDSDRLLPDVTIEEATERFATTASPWLPSSVSADAS